MKRIVVIGIIVIALVSLTVVKLLSNQKEAESKIYIRDKNKRNAVEITTPSFYSFAENRPYQGSFQANKINHVGSESGGKIVSVAVKEGDYIKKGSVIASIDHEMIDIQIEGIQLNLDQLHVDKQRLTELNNENIIAKSELEKIELGIKTAENQLKLLKKQLKSTAIKAPFSGIVTKKMIELGSVIGPGTPTIELLDIKQLKFNFMVSEYEVSNFSIGDEYEIICDAINDKTFKGKVSFISVKADNAHNYKIQLSLNNTDDLKLKAGMYGSVLIKNEEKDTQRMCIPREAMLGSIQNPEVFKVVKDKVKRISFRAGLNNSKFIEVLSGVESGDSIVIKGQINLTDNSNIKIIR